MQCYSFQVSGLATGGIFSWYRNPLYVLIILWFPMTAVVLDTVWPALLAPGMWAYLHFLVRSGSRESGNSSANLCSLTVEDDPRFLRCRGFPMHQREKEAPANYICLESHSRLHERTDAQLPPLCKVVFREEPLLKETFGEDFERYMNATERWPSLDDLANLIVSYL